MKLTNRKQHEIHINEYYTRQFNYLKLSYQWFNMLRPKVEPKEHVNVPFATFLGFFRCSRSFFWLFLAFFVFEAVVFFPSSIPQLILKFLQAAFARHKDPCPWPASLRPPKKHRLGSAVQPRRPGVSGSLCSTT